MLTWSEHMFTLRVVVVYCSGFHPPHKRGAWTHAPTLTAPVNLITNKHVYQLYKENDHLCQNKMLIAQLIKENISFD